MIPTKTQVIGGRNLLIQLGPITKDRCSPYQRIPNKMSRPVH